MDPSEKQRRRAIQNAFRDWLIKIKRTLDLSREEMGRKPLNQREVATRLGTSEGTIKRYMKRAEFKDFIVPEHRTVQTIYDKSDIAPPTAVAEAYSLMREADKVAAQAPSTKPIAAPEVQTPLEFKLLPGGTCLLKMDLVLPMDAALQIMEIVKSARGQAEENGEGAGRGPNRASAKYENPQ